MTNENKISLEKEPQPFLNDVFHLNTEAPPTFASKAKTKLKKWAKPFGLGMGGYFSYLLIKKFFIFLYDMAVATYHWVGSIFSSFWNTISGWIDSIGLFLFHAQTAPAPTPTNPTNINDVTNQLVGNMSGIADLLSAMAYLMGLGFGMQAALSFKQHNEDGGRTPISKPVTYAVVSAMLISLPSLLSVGIDSTFGSGTQQVAKMEQTDSNKTIVINNNNDITPVIVQK